MLSITLVAVLLATAHAARVTFARSVNETRWVPRHDGIAAGASPMLHAAFLQTREPYVDNDAKSGWRTWMPNGETVNGLSPRETLQRSMYKGLTDLNNEQLNPIKLSIGGDDQSGFAKQIDGQHPQGPEPLKWRQRPKKAGTLGNEDGEGEGGSRDAADKVATTTYEVGRYKVGTQCMQAASAQFRNSKRLTITFMNNRFGGRMPPLVVATVHKPRTEEAWDHAYNANLIDVTPHGFVVEVARLDKDAGWCYELDLLWMAYGFANGDEQSIGGDDPRDESEADTPDPGSASG